MIDHETEIREQLIRERENSSIMERYYIAHELALVRWSAEHGGTPFWNILQKQLERVGLIPSMPA